MSKVVALSTFREKKMLEAKRSPEGVAPPVINDGEVMSRDYVKFDNVLFGILKVREVLGYYSPYGEQWKHGSLWLLDAAYRREHGEEDRVAEAVSALKHAVLEEMDSDNKKDVSAVLLILDLIERSPGYRRAARGQP
jgi:hypothetical protein